MRESIAAEFPELARLRPRLRAPAVASESIAWAVLSGAGAGLLAGAVVHVVGAILSPVLPPPTEPQRAWLTPASVAAVAAGVASGAVLVRAAGLGALVAFVAYEAALLALWLPLQQEACARAFPRGPLQDAAIACDLPAMVASRWPEWSALALGAILSRVVLRSSGPGTNRMLRGAGAYALLSALTAAAIGLTARDASPDGWTTVAGLVAVGQLVAGAGAGILLARARRAARVLVAVLVAAPGLIVGLPLAPLPGPSGEPMELAVARLASAIAPAIAAASLLLAAWLARRRLTERAGTFS